MNFIPCVCVCVCDRKLSDKGHRRNNSDGGSTVPMSASLQDLLTLRDTTTTTTTTSSNTTTPRDSDPTSPRRRSVLVTTTTDLQSLTTVDFNKPEVHTPLLHHYYNSQSVGHYYTSGRCCTVVQFIDWWLVDCACISVLCCTFAFSIRCLGSC